MPVKMDKIRLFVAIDIDDEGIAKILSFQNQLKPLTSFVRWTEKSTWHLTLKFLGEQKKDKLSKFISVCESIKKSISPFFLTLKGVGVFPNSRFPRVIFINVEKNPSIINLYNQSETEFEMLNIPKENRDFSPHITLGRVKMPEKLLQFSPDFIPNFLKFGNLFDHSFMVKGFSLYQSILKPQGPDYLKIKQFDF